MAGGLVSSLSFANRTKCCDISGGFSTSGFVYQWNLISQYYNAVTIKKKKPLWSGYMHSESLKDVLFILNWMYLRVDFKENFPSR